MTVPVTSDAARSPHEPTEAAQRDGRHRSRRATLTERDLAELEARLTRDLQHSPSPPIAAADGVDERPRNDTGPLLRKRSLARSHAATGEADAPRVLRQAIRREAPPDRLDDDPSRQVEMRRERRLERLLIELEQLSAPGEGDDPGPQSNVEAVPDRRIARRTTGVLTRVTRVVAAAFSVVVLVGVSALIVVLVAGGEPPATATADDAVLAEQSTVANRSASMPLVSSERVETGATVSKKDMSRVPSEDTASARGGGMVRPIDTQTDRFADAAQPAGSRGVQSALAARVPAEASAPDTAPAAEEPAAPADTAVVEATVVETDDKPAAAAAVREAAPATRSVAVTTHVNLRSGPDNDAAVVAVVPAGRNVDVVDCTQWCEVVYDGRQGFIYRKFVSGAGQ